MPRKHIIQQSHFPYHLVARYNNKERFPIPLYVGWKIFDAGLHALKAEQGFEIHAFVLMSNHFHMLVSTPLANVSAGMHVFMTQTSWRIARESNRINNIYGARYRPTLITTPAHYACTLRYIYQNPLRAKICKRVEEYPWSTYFQRSSFITERADFSEYIPEKKSFSAWLNEVPKNYTELMKKALRRSEFKFPRHPSNKKGLSGLEFL